MTTAVSLHEILPNEVLRQTLEHLSYSQRQAVARVSSLINFLVGTFPEPYLITDLAPKANSDGYEILFTVKNTSNKKCTLHLLTPDVIIKGNKINPQKKLSIEPNQKLHVTGEYLQPLRLKRGSGQDTGAFYGKINCVSIEILNSDGPSDALRVNRELKKKVLKINN